MKSLTTGGLLAAMAFAATGFNTYPSAAEPTINLCDGLQGAAARDCRDALELLTRDVPGPDVELVISATRSEDGWRYRFQEAIGSDHAEEIECVDEGPMVLPQSTSLELLVTSRNELYEWSVSALGLDVAMIPGRVESAVVIIDETGHFDGEIIDISGDRIEDVDASIRVVEKTDFDAWRLEIAARSC